MGPLPSFSDHTERPLPRLRIGRRRKRIDERITAAWYAADCPPGNPPLGVMLAMAWPHASNNPRDRWF